MLKIWNFQRAVVAVVFASAAVFFIFVSTQEGESTFNPITSYVLISDVDDDKRVEIDGLVAAYIGQSFWYLELEQLQSQLAKLDWVYQADVRRQWPGKLILQLDEQVPVVRWGDSALLNKLGDVYYPKQISRFKNLVLLSGEDGRSRDLLKRLSRLEANFSEVDWIITSMVEKADGVLEIKFVDAPTLILDEKNEIEKVVRLLLSYYELSLELRKTTEKIDLRYSNGFVLIQTPTHNINIKGKQ